MIRKIAAMFLVVALTLPVMAQKKAVPLDVVGDTAVVIKSFPCKIVAAKGSHLYDWTVPDAVKADGEDNVLTINSAPNGTFTIKVRASKISVDKTTGEITVAKDFGQTTIIVGTPTPVPPPTPDPPPPTPDPAPIPGDGLKVLIIEDPKQRVKLPPEQEEIIFDASLRQYMNSKCVQDADGKTKAWRIWPDKAETSKQAKYWQDAMKRKRDSLPWIIISNGKTGYEGPLPKDVDSTLALIKKYEK